MNPPGTIVNKWLKFNNRINGVISKQKKYLQFFLYFVIFYNLLNEFKNSVLYKQFCNSVFIV